MYQPNNNAPTYQKAITIANLTSKNINPKPGQNFKPFTIYVVSGNDGINYETSNSQWFSERRVGEMINISYTVESTRGAGGKVYSNYKLMLPVAKREGGASNTEIMDALRKIYQRMDEIEKNLISCVEINVKGISGPDEIIPEPNNRFNQEVPPGLPIVNLDEEEDQGIEEINRDLQEISSGERISPRGGLPF